MKLKRQITIALMAGLAIGATSSVAVADTVLPKVNYKASSFAASFVKNYVNADLNNVQFIDDNGPQGGASVSGDIDSGSLENDIDNVFQGSLVEHPDGDKIFLTYVGKDGGLDYISPVNDSCTASTISQYSTVDVKIVRSGSGNDDAPYALVCSQGS